MEKHDKNACIAYCIKDIKVVARPISVIRNSYNIKIAFAVIFTDERYSQTRIFTVQRDKVVTLSLWTVNILEY